MRAVIGVDSGGTHTRALALSLEGEAIGYAETAGGNRGHDSRFQENIRGAITQAAASCGIGNVVRIVAGIAGYDQPGDLQWIAPCTEIEGFQGERVHVNDAEVAHFGAFVGGPGIVSIQGSGSMILGITEEGRLVRNLDFGHYGRASGHTLGLNGLVAILTGTLQPADQGFLDSVLAYWEVDSLPQLRLLGSRDWGLEFEHRRRRWGQMAPLITAAAMQGSPIARRICDAAADSVCEGICLLGPLFAEAEVRVALIGSTVRSEYLSHAVESRLAIREDKAYTVATPAHSPVIGAALMALRQEVGELPETLTSTRFLDLDTLTPAVSRGDAGEGV